MYTYKVKTGDVAVFPNGVEVNYDESNETLVVLHPDKRKGLVVTQIHNEATVDVFTIGVEQ